MTKATLKKPTIILELSDGHQIELSAEDFVKLHNELTELYNKHYQIIESDHE